MLALGARPFGAVSVVVALMSHEVNTSLAAFAPSNDSFRMLKEGLHGLRT
jgi:hypothetical protein